MDFKKFIPAVMAVLGIEAFSKEGDRTVLTADQRSALAAAGFPAQFAADFEASLNDSAKADRGEDSNARVAALSAVLGQVTSQLTEANAQLASMQDNAKAYEAQQARVRELESRVAALSALPEPDTAQAAGDSNTAFNLDDELQLCGKQGAMFALDRPYNQRARAAIYARRGMSLPVAAASSVDYSSLTEDLGAFYRQPWRDRLQSLLTELPSLEAIFPTESGYQDLATLVNVWLGDFSQADNTIGSSFDNVTKGSYDFGTETLRMFSVMFAHKFQNLAQLEKTWIGGMNREGSDPVKISFVEYLLAETAKKLHNEREIRRINGVRRNPNPNEPGRALDAADGLYEFIRKKVDGHIDYTPDGGTTGKTVYQIKPFELGEITGANIGEVLYQGTSLIPSHLRDSGNIVCYLPSHLVPLYHKYNEAKYGVNQDYQGAQMCIKEFPAVKLIPVPNADNHFRVIWTVEGNIKCYEQTAGEMLNFRIEQQDWSLKVWANWKESIWAEAVGYKYTDRADMDGSRQMIWVNEYDFAPDYFIEGTPGTNPDVTRHSSVAVGTGEITDIKGAEVGKAVTLKAAAAGVSVKKAGVFSLLSAAWTPEKGDTLTLIKRNDGKFIEIERAAAATGSALMFAADDTTPSLEGGSVFVTGINTAAIEITGFADAVVGAIYTIHGNGAAATASTIKNGGNFALTADIVLKDGAAITLTKAADGKFYELKRI